MIGVVMSSLTALHGESGDGCLNEPEGAHIRDLFCCR